MNDLQFTILLLLLLPGCGNSYESQISGTVSLDGKPLGVGMVTFHPTGQGPVAYGQIRPDGSYSIRTGAAGGLPPGEYLVTVTAFDPSQPAELPPHHEGEPSPGKLLVPLFYTNLQETDLRFHVKKGANHIDLELQSK